MAGKKSIEIKFRPSVAADKVETAPLKGASRIYIRKDSLIDLTGSLDNGRACYIERVDAPASSSPDAPRREAILWLSPDPSLGKAVAKISRTFQQAADLNFTDVYRIVVADVPAEDAREVVLEDITAAESKAPSIQDKWMTTWVANVKAELDILDFVFPGMIIRDITFARDKRTFAVRSVNGRPTANCRVVPESTEVVISAAAKADDAAPSSPASLKVAGIRELPDLTTELNDFLFQHSEESLFQRWHGLVLHGGKGTGKTMLLDQVAHTGWGSVHRIKPTEKSSVIQDVFKAALAQQPGVIVIDEMETLLDKERPNHSTVVNALVEALDSVSTLYKTNGARPRVVLVAACQDYVTDIPLKLREPGRFERSLLIPPLDAERRESLISAYFGPVIHPKLRKDIVTSLSQRTHAYNGSDLRKVMHLAESLIEKKLRSINVDAGGKYEENGSYISNDQTMTPDSSSGNQKADDEDAGQQQLSEDPLFYSNILDTALLKVRPTAMQDVNLKPPPVYWSDISGQDGVKKDLRFAVSLLTLPRETVQEYLGSPPKGFLLYGPPGCSKTMTAQAMATESGLNFLAVKGAELLNMYVGESERQVRSLFARARAAAPSMIFFDEIDSIAGSRKGFGDGSASSSQGGLNVLTTLLNEMDGFEDLRGVLVLAATNRPQSLDPAIMRPGRFDEIVYVPPPDAEAREAIFIRHTAGRRLADDVDFRRLAELSDGHSGAECVSICRTAGKMAMIRLTESQQKKSVQVAVASEDEEWEDEEDMGIRMSDFLEAKAGQRKMITKEMLDVYAVWEKQFR